mmetsp:Transcript_11000/g.41076  ORF Transcript_11000/g.41076 Transcript_11000/m.41076 type:complete len:163 (+) Transcript_11000:4639-5127(+)
MRPEQELVVTKSLWALRKWTKSAMGASKLPLGDLSCSASLESASALNCGKRRDHSDATVESIGDDVEGLSMLLRHTDARAPTLPLSPQFSCGRALSGAAHAPPLKRRAPHVNGQIKICAGKKKQKGGVDGFWGFDLESNQVTQFSVRCVATNGRTPCGLLGE